MRSLLFLAALLALAAPAFASLGDNGMETYSGRKRAPNTVVFGNQLVIDLAVQSSVGFAAELLKGTFKPTPNQPATEKKEVSRVWIKLYHSVSPRLRLLLPVLSPKLPTRVPHHAHPTPSLPPTPTTPFPTHPLTHSLTPGPTASSTSLPPTHQTQIFLECLNSVAPAPLNWKMWCPSDAKIMQWNDNSGALHRQITVRPQAGMTSTMAIWWITSHLAGIMPPVTEFEGNVSRGGGVWGGGAESVQLGHGLHRLAVTCRASCRP